MVARSGSQVLPEVARYRLHNGRVDIPPFKDASVRVGVRPAVTHANPRTRLTVSTIVELAFRHSKMPKRMWGGGKTRGRRTDAAAEGCTRKENV